MCKNGSLNEYVNYHRNRDAEENARMQRAQDQLQQSRVDQVNKEMAQFGGMALALGAIGGTSIGGAGLFAMEASLASGISDFAAQLYVKGDIKDVNIVSSLAAGFFKNPLIASVPGGLINLSPNTIINNRPIFQSPLQLETWKSIGLNTLGNMLGDRSEALIIGGYGELGIDISKRFTGKFIGQQIGDVPSGFIDEGTNSK